MLAALVLLGAPLTVAAQQRGIPEAGARRVGHAGAAEYLAAEHTPIRGSVRAGALVCIPGDPRCPPPDVTITPSDGTFSSAVQTVTVNWCGHAPLDNTSRQITLNGVDVTANFSYSTSVQSGCSSHATSTGSVTLATGGNTLTAYIEDNISQSGSSQVYYTFAGSAEGVTINLAPHNGTNRDVSLCVANCFDQVVSYSTPSYRSLDQDRSLTIMYRSSQATPISTVTLDVVDTAAGKTASLLSLTILDGNGAVVTQLNGRLETFFANQPAQTLRIAGQFDASGLTSGAYMYSAAVKSYYTDGTSRTTTRPVRVLVINERSSPYGAGWSVAGLQRVYPEPSGYGVAIVDGMGSMQYFSGPCTGNPCTYTSPAGDYTTVQRTSAGGWTRRAPDGTTVTFDASGYATSVADRFANTTSYAYNGARLNTVTDPVGQVTYVSPSSGSYTITAPSSRVSTVTLDGANRVTDIQDPAGGHPFTAPLFDMSGYLMSQWSDRRGGMWSAGYDNNGHAGTQTTPTIMADGVSQRLQTRGQHVDFQTTGSGTGAGTSSSPYTATLAANVTATTTDARNNTTRYVVDAFLAPTRITDALGRVTTIARDGASRVTNVTTPSGHSVTTTWSGPNAISIVDNTTGRTINYQYDSRYNLLANVSGHTASVVNYLNAAGTLVDSTKTGGALATKIKYDSRGRDTLLSDPEGHTTRKIYGAGVWNNIASVEVGVGHKTSYAYDNAGLVATTTDALNNTSRVSYDVLNRTRVTVGPRGDSTSFEYDSLYLWRVTDARHQTYRYDRNALGWVETFTDPGSRTTTTTYDPNGNPRSQTNRRGQTVTTSYDAVNRPLQLGTDPQRTTTFTYDVGDRWMTATNGASTDTIGLDVAGRRIVEIARRPGLTLRMADTSTYDEEGSLGVRTSLQWDAIGHFVRYHYDAAYQLTSLLTGGWYTTLGSNNDRMASTIGYPSGATQSNGFSSDHSRTQTTFSPAGGALDRAFQVATHEDSLGRVTTRFHYADTSRVYSYDEAGQLTGYYDQILGQRTCIRDVDKGFTCDYFNQTILGGETYSYDLVGNRTDGGATIDAGNRLRSFQGFSLSYDADGNLVRKIKSGVADDSLEWNALGELTRVLRSGAVVAEFTYDGFGRRVTKIAGGAVTQYQWDDDQVIAERDGSGNYIAEYAFYPGVDKPHSVTTSAGTFTMASEAPGNVIGLWPYEGSTVSAQYAYKPFGAMERNDQTVTNSLRFQARPYDQETGLYYYRARYYDPTLARFISEDPIGLAGGVNPYVFVGNDPINDTDPTGLDSEIDDGWDGSWETLLDMLRTYPTGPQEPGSESPQQDPNRKPLPACMVKFLKRYYPHSQVDRVVLLNGSPPGFGNNSVTFGYTINLASPAVFQNPASDPFHIFHEYTHVRQYEAGTLSVAGYLADWARVGFVKDSIPSEIQADRNAAILADVFVRTPEGRSCKQ
ncbi:MAG TPA: RHS repeat-associated core domain-containing protein [Vicinamibacterales bacterium]